MSALAARREQDKDPVRLRISRLTWHRMIRELRLRGDGSRESGAFLLASLTIHADSTSAPTVRRVIYYDDLDPACLTGGITLAGHAYDTLWQICAESRLSVVADIHTHPLRWVDQSPMDAANPMIGIPGHLALIIPRFAASPVNISEVGVHVYEGRHLWQRLQQSNRGPILVTLFANLGWWHVSRNAVCRLASWGCARARSLVQWRKQ